MTADLGPERAALQAAGALQQSLRDADPAACGDPAGALAAARRARELALAHGLAPEAARAGVWICQHLLRIGLYGQVLAEAAALKPEVGPQPPGSPLAAERREFLRVLALAACEAAEFGVAFEAAHELVRDSEDHDDAGAALNATFALAACLERMGDSWQAIRLLADAVARHGDRAAGLPLLIARNGLVAIWIGMFHRLHGAAPASETQPVLARARAAAEQARAMLADAANPNYEVAVDGNLGELLMYQGELDGAEQLLQQALATARARGLIAHGWRVRASLGVWLRLAGRVPEARAELDALLAEMGERAPQQTEIRARHAAWAACRALGDHEAALAHFERYEQLERERATRQLRAQSELFVTRTEAQRALGHAERAEAEAARQREQALAATERAERDPLTGVGNRHLLERRFPELLRAAEQASRPFAVVLLDVDHFKQINDLHGHAGGDAVLSALGALLRESTREGDLLARLGGEEFVLLLPALQRTAVLELCERLRERIATHTWSGLPPQASVSVSVGVAHAPPYDERELLRRADTALYAAKRAGRNRVCDAG